jgi:hypothetical protein
MPDSGCAPSAPVRDSPAIAPVTHTRPGSTDGMVELAGGELLMGNAGLTPTPTSGVSSRKPDHPNLLRGAPANRDGQAVDGAP